MTEFTREDWWMNEPMIQPTKDDIPVCPDCIQGKHSNCSGTSWNNTKDEETTCPCTDSHAYSIYGPGQGLDKKHDEIVTTITSVMYQSVMTREDLEDMLSQRISDLQWDRVNKLLHDKTKYSNRKE